MAVNFPKLIVALILPFIAGFIGSYFTTPAIPGWYQQLDKPWFNPPNWIFAPVWTVLYVLMGVSLYLVWNSRLVKSEKKTKGFQIFTVQILLNTLWSIVFFGLRSPEGGVIVILLLIASIIANILIFYRIRKIAAYLLFPYLLWVSFATILNIFVMVNN